MKKTLLVIVLFLLCFASAVRAQKYTPLLGFSNMTSFASNTVFWVVDPSGSGTNYFTTWGQLTNVLVTQWRNETTNAVNSTTRSVQVAAYTNFPVLTTYQLYCCYGTNQIVTLPNCTNSPLGLTLTFSSTNANGSFWVTNAIGTQTIGDGISPAKTNTGVGAFSIFNDGTSWWLR